MGKLAGLNWKGAGGSMLSNLMKQQGQPQQQMQQPYMMDIPAVGSGAIEPATTMMPLNLRY
jgi:hypothetical protein